MLLVLLILSNFFEKIMLSKQDKRILDVNRNRITEGLRVVEDFLRFSKSLVRYAKKVKKMRHKVFQIFEDMEKDMGKLIFSRDSVSDRGRKEDYDKCSKPKKMSKVEVVRKNLKRACEGVRVSEEVMKSCGNERVFLLFKELRFEMYDIEKDLETVFSKKAFL